MRAINRLLEISLFNKYQKYVREKLIPKLSKYLGTTLNIVPSSITPYGFFVRGKVTSSNKYIDVIIKFTNNDNRIEDGDALLVDLVVNGKSFPTSIKGKNVEEDIDALAYQFEMASRYFDVDLALDDVKFEEV